GVAGAEDISLEHLLLLRGMLTAIKDGDTTPEQAFAPEGAPAGAKPSVSMPKAKSPAPDASAPPAGAPVDPATGEISGAAAAPAPSPAPAPSGNGALATDGERQLIVKRARSAGLEMA